MLQFINMKAGKLSICLLGLFTSMALVATNVNQSFAFTHASNNVEGYYAKASSGANLNNIKFDLEENSAPQASYKPASIDAMKLIREDGSINYLPESYVNATIVFTKVSATQYQIPTTVLQGVKGGISRGDTIVLDGNFTSDDCTLHIKESKLYVYTKDAIVTVPHSVKNITSCLDNLVSSKEARDREWAFLLWSEGLSFDDFLRTVDDGYYPTSIHNVYVDGQPHANCLYDALRRRDPYDPKALMYEIYVCATGQIGTDNPNIGTVVVLDGVFNYKNYVPGQYSENPILDLEPGESYGIQIGLLTLLKVGAGVDDYVRINLKSYLLEQFELLYNPDLYEPDLYLQISEMQDALEASLKDLTTAKDIYSAYNYYVSQMGLLELTEESFQSFKNAYIKEVMDYVDVSLYWDSVALTIQGYVDDCINTINNAVTTKQVVDAVNEVKTKVDKTHTRLYDMEQAILNRTSGWENYLAQYDYVTLDDLSLGESQVFHGRKSERQNDIDTYDKEKNQIDTFVPSAENKAGNVAFCFNYQADAVPTKGANIFIVLRGIKYFGYCFAMGTNSKGFFFQRTQGGSGEEDTDFEGRERCFMSTSKIPVVIRAIDLIEGNRTWINVNIGGFDYLDKIVDSLSFATNSRVSFRNNIEDDSDVDGIATISNYYHPKAKDVKAKYYGLFNYDGGHNDEDETLYLSLDDNELKYDAVEGINSYAIRSDNIKLIRNNVEYKLGRTDVPVIGKYSASSYRLYLSNLFNNEIGGLVDGDTIVVSGAFAYFDDDPNDKVAFEVGTSKFVYSASSKSWSQIVSLEDAKKDAIRQLDYYVSEDYLEQFDEAEKEQVTNIVNNAVLYVNNQTSVEGVYTVFNNAVNSINTVMTSLQKYQQEVISLISSYKQDEYGSYRQEELDLIMSYKQEATESVYNASSRKEIDDIYQETIEKIDAVLTDEEMSIKELKEAKYQGVNTIKNRYASLINSSMSDEKLEKLNNETIKSIENVQAASSIEEVNSVVNAYLKAHPLPNSGSSGCDGSIATSSIIISALAASFLTMLIIKKWKYKLIGGQINE